jgi:hypothetical protein
MSNQSSIGAILQELHYVATREAETVTLLAGLRKILVELAANSFSPSEGATATQATFLYIISKFVNDLWFNLCGDASFDFPKQSPEIKAIGTHLRDFLTSVSLPQPNIGDGMQAFGRAVESYYQFVLEKNRQLEGCRSGAI